MAERERFFECVFVSDRNEYQFHFRARSEVDAAQHFERTLRGYGLTAPGTLLVRDEKGQVLRRADYHPSTAGDAAR